jgi:hypothetical protein
MECDYTHLNHNLLASQKKSGHLGCDYKWGLLYWVECKCKEHLRWWKSFSTLKCTHRFYDCGKEFDYFESFQCHDK